MKAPQVMAALLVFLVASLMGADGFTTKKQERHQPASFQSPVKEGGKKTSDNNNLASHSGATGPLFALPSPAAYAAVPQEYQQFMMMQEEEEDVSYGVALVSCMLSLALGFGLGYGT